MVLLQLLEQVKQMTDKVVKVTHVLIIKVVESCSCGFVHPRKENGEIDHGRYLDDDGFIGQLIKTVNDDGSLRFSREDCFCY